MSGQRSIWCVNIQQGATSEKCKKRNPYPKLKPRKQTKLGFLPVQKPTESPEPILEPNFQIASSSGTETEENVSTVVNAGDSIIPDPPRDDQGDDDDNISAVDGGTTL